MSRETLVPGQNHRLDCDARSAGQFAQDFGLKELCHAFPAVKVMIEESSPSRGEYISMVCYSNSRLVRAPTSLSIHGQR